MSRNRDLYPLFVEDGTVRIQNLSSGIVSQIICKKGVLYAEIEEDYEDDNEGDLVDILNNTNQREI